MPWRPNPNKIEIIGDIAIMTLVRKDGKEIKTIFDAEDAPKVRSVYYRWRVHYDPKLGNYYVVSHGMKKGEMKPVRLSRLVMNCPDGLVVDHINHNTLDNRKANLRVVPQQINLLNKKGAYKNSKTGVRGVYWHKATGKWYAQVHRNSKKVYYQLFDRFEDACKAAEEARKKIFKEVV